MTISRAMSISAVNQERPARDVMVCQSYSLKRAKKRKRFKRKGKVIFPFMIKFY